MLHPPLPVCSKKIESETILFQVCCFCQLTSQSNPLCRINKALKNRVLYPLSKILTDFCNTMQSPFTGKILRAHIIRHKYHHLYTLLFPEKWWVFINIIAQKPGEQHRLNIYQ